MSDIFISYSRKDSEQALQLAERLRNDGMSVWIDQQGIEAAKSWSAEIVDAIEACRAFVVLLSSNSIESENVAKELSIAYESKRTLLPVALEDVALTRTFKYPLAGVQRVAYTQHDAITQALIGCGVSVTLTARKKDDRKSLLVMPFEDLSPTQDNMWFADGLAGELIDKLSPIKSLRLIDRKTSRDLRQTKLSMYNIAETLDVQYVIEGSVRKFGDQIKISMSLLDINGGDYMWQESHKGVMDDIFELQENVAEKVVDALKLHLGSTERAAVTHRPTNSSEAYEIRLKAFGLFQLQTRQAYDEAIRLATEAVQLDNNYADGYDILAQCHLILFQKYDPAAWRLSQAREALIKFAAASSGESAQYLASLAKLALCERDLVSAEALARRAIETDPTAPAGYGALGNVLGTKGDIAEMVEVRKKYLDVKQTPTAHWNYLLALRRLNAPDRVRDAAKDARLAYEKQRRLDPGDETASVRYANVLFLAGDLAAARNEALRLEPRLFDSQNLYNLACLFILLGDASAALRQLRKAAAAGYAEVSTISRDEDVDSLRHLPEFQEILAMVNENANRTKPNV